MKKSRRKRYRRSMSCRKRMRRERSVEEVKQGKGNSRKLDGKLLKKEMRQTMRKNVKTREE